MSSRIFIRQIEGRIKIKEGDFIQRLKITLGSSMATFSAVAFGQPFDTVKVRMQQKNQPFIAAAKSFFYEGSGDKLNFAGGVNGLYRGFLPTASKRALLSSARTQLMFGVPPVIADITGCKDQKGKPDFWANVLSAFLIAAPDTLMCNLFEFSKVYKQTGGSYKAMFSKGKDAKFDDVVNKWSDNFLRGYWLTYFKAAFGWSTFFAVYKVANDANKLVNGSDKIQPELLVAAAGAEAVIKVAVTTPIDVIKTNVQSYENVNKDGPIKVARNIYNKHGAAAFSRGFAPRILHGGISSLIGYAALEVDKRWKSDDDKGRQ